MAHTSKHENDISSIIPDNIDDVPYRGLTPVRINHLQDTPIRLQLQRRSPRQILEQKAKVKTTIPTKKDAKNPPSKIGSADECSIFDTDKEVRMKLHYLNIIDALIQGVSLENLSHFNELKELKRLLAEASVKEDNVKVEALRQEERFWRQKAMLEAKRHIHAEDEELCRSQLIMMWSVRSFSSHRPSAPRRLRKLDSHQMSKLISMV